MFIDNIVICKLLAYGHCGNCRATALAHRDVPRTFLQSLVHFVWTTAHSQINDCWRIIARQSLFRLDPPRVREP
uniref:Uncharacterized protein n=1 Tax=Pararge aegeria TaxID=116150 RepID=S4PGJ7_9NEOP